MLKEEPDKDKMTKIDASRSSDKSRRYKIKQLKTITKVAR